MANYPVLEIAKKIISDSNTRSNGGEYITNLKLQKMLYYMQGFHLAYFREPLFEDEIEAWMYGPVVPKVYHEYSCFGNKGIDVEYDDIIRLTNIEEQLFDEVLNVYGAFSAIGLMNMTHNETPWKSTKIGEGNVISKQIIYNFFKKRLR